MKTTRVVCRDCEGRGQWFGYTSNDPGERPRWHPCFECGGSGSTRVIEIPDDKGEDD